MPVENSGDGGNDGQRTATNDQQTRSGREPRAETTGWMASTAVRLGLLIIGVVVLLFALGQAFDMDLLGAVGDALSSEVGRWLAVAFVALLIIGVAERGLRRSW